jgi:2'-5' RNA ligase
MAAQFSSVADGYCLEDGVATPHVTMCQFRAENELIAKQLVAKFLPKKLSLRFESFCYQEGNELPHLGKFWATLNVVRKEALIKLQTNLNRNIERRATEILTRRGDQYLPHLTLARLAILPSENDTYVVDESIFDVEINCELQLGHSDENGQFLQVIPA